MVGAAFDGRRPGRRQLADVRARRGGPVARARRATARGVRRDQGLDELRPGGPQPLRPPARLVRRPGRPAPGPQPRRVAGASRLDGARTRRRQHPLPRGDDLRVGGVRRAREGDAHRPGPRHPGPAQPARTRRRGAGPAARRRARPRRRSSCARSARAGCSGGRSRPSWRRRPRVLARGSPALVPRRRARHRRDPGDRASRTRPRECRGGLSPATGPGSCAN